MPVLNLALLVCISVCLGLSLVWISDLTGILRAGLAGASFSAKTPQGDRHPPLLQNVMPPSPSSGPSRLSPSAGPPSPSLPSPWYAVNLSLLFPGLGHFYGGQIGRGLLWLILGIGLLATTIWAFLGANGDVQIGAGCLGMGLVLWVFSVIDAYSCLSQAPKQQFRSFASQERKDKTVKDIWFSVFLSQLLPGLGHLQANRLVAGAIFLVVTLLWFTAAALFRSVMMGLGLLLAIACAQLAWQLSFQPVRPAAAPQLAAAGRTGTGTTGSAAELERSESSSRFPVNLPLRLSPAPAVTQAILRKGLALALLILLSRSLMFGSVALAEQWVEPFAVPSESMWPTLQVGDRILVSKSNRYRPERGDIVVFRSRYFIGRDNTVAESEESHFFVKRLVAMAGDQIEISQGQLLLNGLPLNERYLAEPIGYEMPPTVLLPGQLFVLGDNRNFSFDSHVWGALSTQDVVGKAYRISWPPARNRAL